jgi:hypothetical protein
VLCQDVVILGIMKKQAKEPMTIEDLAGRMDGLFEQVDGRFGQLEI